MSDFDDLGLPTREACPGDLLKIDFVGDHGIMGFIPDADGPGEPVVVIVPPGTKLILDDIPRELQARLGVRGCAFAEADTRTPNLMKSPFKDGLLFTGIDGHVSLQELRPGIRALVRSSFL